MMKLRPFFFGTMLTFSFCTFVQPFGGDLSWKRRGVWSHLVLPPGLFSSPADCGAILQFANADAWSLDDTSIVPTDLGQTMWKHRDLYRALRSRFEIEVKRKLGVILVTPYASTCRPETSRRTDDKDVKYKFVWFQPGCHSGIPAGDVGPWFYVNLWPVVDKILVLCLHLWGAKSRPELWKTCEARVRIIRDNKVLNVIFREHLRIKI